MHWPDSPDPEADNYSTRADHRPFSAFGRPMCCSALKGQGPGFRVIGAVQTEGGRTILVDRGFLPEARRIDLGLPDAELQTLVGNLQMAK